MKHPIRVVFFDLGNTLLYDDKEAWKEVYPQAEEALWTALRLAGVEISRGELYRDYPTLFHYYYKMREKDLDEPGISNTLERLLTEHRIAIPNAKLRTAIHSMFAVTQRNWHLEEDAVPTLRTLKERGFRLGAISNSSDDPNTQELIDKTDLRPYFEFIVSSAAFGKRKPHPSIFQHALDYFQVPPEQTAMVGDTLEADIDGANRLGMFSIWVTRRAETEQSRDGRIRPRAQVERLAEIPVLLSRD